MSDCSAILVGLPSSSWPTWLVTTAMENQPKRRGAGPRMRDLESHTSTRRAVVRTGHRAMLTCQGSWKSLFQCAQLETQKKKGDHILGDAKWPVSGVPLTDYMSIQVKIKKVSASQYYGLYNQSYWWSLTQSRPLLVCCSGSWFFFFLVGGGGSSRTFSV